MRRIVAVALLATACTSTARPGTAPSGITSITPPPPHLLDGGGVNSLDLSFGDGDGTARLDATVLISTPGPMDRDFTIDGANVRATLTRDQGFQFRSPKMI